MRAIGACVVALAFAAPLSACRRPSPTGDVALMEATDQQYLDCVVAQSRKMAASEDSAETVATAALDACPDQLSNVHAVDMSSVGPGYTDELITNHLRPAAKRLAVAAVAKARVARTSPLLSAAGHLSPEFGRAVDAWSSCLTEQSEKLAISTEPAATVAEAAFASCWTQQSAVRDMISHSYGAPIALREIERLRQELKGHVEADVIRLRQFLARRPPPAPAAPPSHEALPKPDNSI